VEHNPTTQSFFFRGDIGRNATVNISECGKAIPYERCFDYDTLMTYLHRRASNETGTDLPAQFQFIDVSLISNYSPDERTDLLAEYQFFMDHPSLGWIWNWPMHGQFVCPWEYDMPMRETLAKQFADWDKDDLVSSTQQLKNIIDGSIVVAKVPHVVYAHCEEGMDRTGQLVASYQMRYLGWSFPKAMAAADSVGYRPILEVNRCAAQWMCLYLEYVENISGLDCMNNSTQTLLS
jgi:hypothetical protein